MAVDFDILKSKLTEIERELDKIVNELILTSATDTAKFLRLEKKVRDLYAKAVTIFRSWSYKNFPVEYKKELLNVLTKIKNIETGLSKTEIDAIRKTLTSIKNIDVQTAKILDNVVSSFVTGAIKGEENLVRLIRQTQQLLISEKNVNKLIEEGFQDSGAIGGSIKKLKTALSKKVEEEGFITIIDKNGMERTYTLSYYSELVARTKLHEQSTTATLNTMNALGMDLIQISSHNTKTEYDAQFEGKIYSLSGNDPDFPAVIDLPPFHPNCLHSSFPTSREQLGLHNELEKYIEFSNGVTSKPPNKPSFTPLDKRNFKGQSLEKETENRTEYLNK